MAAYDDSRWVQNLESLGLTEDDVDDARTLLASKDYGFRQGMLGGSTAESNRRVILKALRLRVSGDGAVPKAMSEYKDPFVISPDKSRCEMHGRVGRLMEGDETIGSCCRLSGGLVVTARHCISSPDVDRSRLHAFGGTLTFMASNPLHDIAIFKGEKGPHFILYTAPVPVGTRVEVWSYPKAVDVDVPGAASSQEPVASSGQVSGYGASLMLACADYQGTMSNSSGGAVVISSQELVGVHIGSCWHKEVFTSIADSDRCPSTGGMSIGQEATASLSSGGSGEEVGGSDYGSSGRGKLTHPPDMIETDMSALWRDPEEESDVSLHDAAYASLVNMQRKSQLGLYATVAALVPILRKIHLAPADFLEESAAEVSQRPTRLSKASKRTRRA